MIATKRLTTVCALCSRQADELVVGLCPSCRASVPAQGGCGLALQVAAALIGEAERGTDSGDARAHLGACPACRKTLEGVAQAMLSSLT